MRYPSGIFSFVCIGTFIGARCALYQPAYRWPLGVLYGLLLLSIYRYARCYFKTVLCSFVLSLTIILGVFLHLRQRPAKGQFYHGTFVFEKIFHTDPQRIGGIGRLTLPDGQQRTLYVHGPRKYPINLEDATPYRFSGYVKPLKDPFNHSQNFSFYLWSRGMRYHTTSGAFWEKSTPPTLLKRCKQSLFRALTTPNEAASQVYRAILMGKKEVLDRERLDSFFYTGTMHLFAVSGLHVGVVSAFLFFLCKLLCFPLRLRCVLTGLGVCFYGMIVGFSPSTTRAVIMIFFVLLAQMVQRPIDIRAAFFNTIGLTLCFNPYELWDVGFQLSYGVVASIIFIGIPLSFHCAHRLHLTKKWQWTCIVSLCASGMSTFFSLYYWEFLCPWSFLANLVLIPLASLIVVLGMSAWCLSLCLPILLPVLSTLACGCISLLLWTVQVLERMPGSRLTFSLPNPIFYSFLLLFCTYVFCAPESSSRSNPQN